MCLQLGSEVGTGLMPPLAANGKLVGIIEEATVVGCSGEQQDGTE
jgi:hypothetical protein